jgi:hypothetical protein
MIAPTLQLAQDALQKNPDEQLEVVLQFDKPQALPTESVAPEMLLCSLGRPEAGSLHACMERIRGNVALEPWLGAFFEPDRQFVAFATPSGTAPKLTDMWKALCQEFAASGSSSDWKLQIQVPAGCARTFEYNVGQWILLRTATSKRTVYRVPLRTSCF